MPNIANLSDTAANAEANALAPLCNSGTIKIYSGPQPLNANTDLVGGNTLLATLTFGSTAFGAAAGGVITADAITPGTIVANGTASFARIFESDGVTVVMDVPLGTFNAAIIFNTLSFVEGATVSISACVFNVTET